MSAHILSGLIVCVWTFGQHVIGVALHYFGQFKFEHISSGKLLFIVARAAVVVGWLVTANYPVAAGAGAVIAATSAILWKLEKPAKIKAS